MVRDDNTSSTLISRTPTNSRSVIAWTASGLRMAWRRVATEICANWALVVPYWYIWRLLTMAYPPMVVRPQGSSMFLVTVGTPTPVSPAVPMARRSEWDVDPYVTSATLHLPAAIMALAWLV